MPLKTQANGDASATSVTAATTGTNGTYLTAGGEPCIGVQLVNRARRDDGTYSPAHIKLTAHTANSARGVCEQVRNSKVVNDYFNSTVLAANGTDNINAAIPVGSSKGIYGATPPPPPGDRRE